jgi:hypothetical protein
MSNDPEGGLIEISQIFFKSLNVNIHVNRLRSMAQVVERLPSIVRP